MSSLKRVAAINDLSGYGKCSLTVVLPVLSCMGIEACPLPTAILSAHTGYPDPVFVDFTPHMQEFAEHWKKLNVGFDAIFTGFLGSLEQIEIVEKFIDDFGKDALILVDPVMADNGKIYSTYTPKMCESMKLLVSKADVITPNLTEATLLLGIPYSECLTEKECFEIAKKLCALGPDKVVITGIIIKDKIINVFYDANADYNGITSSPLLDANLSGTGDIFSSIICASLLTDRSLLVGVKCATSFTHDVIALTKRTGCQDCICFEPLLGKLACGDFFK